MQCATCIATHSNFPRSLSALYLQPMSFERSCQEWATLSTCHLTLTHGSDSGKKRLNVTLLQLKLTINTSNSPVMTPSFTSSIECTTTTSWFGVQCSKGNMKLLSSTPVKQSILYQREMKTQVFNSCLLESSQWVQFSLNPTSPCLGT